MKKLMGMVFGLAISFASFAQIPSGPWQVLEPSNTALKRHESGLCHQHQQTPETESYCF